MVYDFFFLTGVDTLFDKSIFKPLTALAALTRTLLIC